MLALKKSRGMFGYVAVLLLMVLTISMLFTNGFGSNTRDRRITYPQLLTMIEEGQVRSVAIRGTSLVGVTTTTTVADADFPDKNYDFETTIGADFIVTARQMQAAKLNKPLDEVSVKDLPFTIIYRQPLTTPWWYDLIPLAISLVLCGVMFWLIMRAQTGGNGKVMNFGRSRARIHDPNKNKVTFADVAGAEEEKEELKEMVDFLRNPKAYIDMGARIPKGVLLIGPPGTGKTLLAKAVAGEAGVPFFSISGSDFVEMFVGVGASRVRDLFDQAKRAAPSIIFIDEIDAVGRHRGAGLGGGHDEREQTLNQLLVEMDGFEANDGVIVMAATNRADILDKALLRPGRFDRQVYVGLPDVKGREEILKVHTKNKPLAPDVSLKVIAQRTAGFAGADLENLVNEAALLAARRSRKAITMEDIEEASMKVMAGPEKKSRVVTPEEKKLTAYHEAGHAVAGFYCKHHPRVHEITIIPRGQAGGYTMYLPEKDRSYVTKGEMFEDIVSSLGGRVAEQLILDDISTGASNDLQQATNIARQMITKYGFSERLGPVVYGTSQEETFLGRDLGQGKGYSETTAAEIDSEMRDIIDEAYETCRRTLTEHIDQLHALAQALMEREKLNEKEFNAVMAGETLPQREDPDAKPAEDQPAVQPVEQAETAEAAEPAEPAEAVDAAPQEAPAPETPDEGEANQ